MQNCSNPQGKDQGCDNCFNMAVTCVRCTADPEMICQPKDKLKEDSQKRVMDSLLKTITEKRKQNKTESSVADD